MKRNIQFIAHIHSTNANDANLSNEETVSLSAFVILLDGDDGAAGRAYHSGGDVYLQERCIALNVVILHTADMVLQQAYPHRFGGGGLYQTISTSLFFSSEQIDELQTYVSVSFFTLYLRGEWQSSRISNMQKSGPWLQL